MPPQSYHLGFILTLDPIEFVAGLKRKNPWASIDDLRYAFGLIVAKARTYDEASALRAWHERGIAALP